MNATGKTIEGKKKKGEKKNNTNIILMDHFYAIMLMFPCELYIISAIHSKYFSNHGYF